MKYYFMGKDKPFSIGPYPEVSLAQAREKTKEARKLLKTGIDPTAHKQQEKTAALTAHKNTFRALAEEWHTKNIEKWDSLGHLNILTELDKSLKGKAFKLGALAKAYSIKEIVKVLKSHKLLK
jgi:hypothetical protein